MPLAIRDVFEGDRDFLLFSAVVVDEVARIREEASKDA